MNYMNEYLHFLQILASWKVELTNNSIKQEIAVMKRLKHPNIVALHEVINDPTARKIFLIQEVIQEMQWVLHKVDVCLLYIEVYGMCGGKFM